MFIQNTGLKSVKLTFYLCGTTVKDAKEFAASHLS